MEEFTEKIATTYKNSAKIPNVVDGVILPGGSEGQFVIETLWQQRDLERNENLKFRKWSCINVSDNEVQPGSKIPASETNSEQLVRYNGCGTKKVLIREHKVDDKTKHQYLEIWESGRKSTNVNLTTAERHGIVLHDTQFGSLEWSPDGEQILYIAEPKSQNRTFFDRVNKETSQLCAGEKHVWKDSWGEQLSEAKHPSVCVFDVKSEEVMTLRDIIPERVSAGQAVWCNDSKKIVFIGWKEDPFKLGIRYCTNRASNLYIIDLAKKVCKQLTKGEQSVYSPRIHPQQNFAVYLENLLGGPHHQCSQLMMLELKSSDAFLDSSGNVYQVQPKVIVERVKSTAKVTDFPGLYLHSLPKNCWTADASHVILTSAWRSHECALAIDLKDGSVLPLTERGESIVLDVKNNLILICQSDPLTSWNVRVASFSNKRWFIVEEPAEDSSAYMNYSVHSVQPELKNKEYPSLDYEFIMIEPKEAKNCRTLIVNPHGGPHTHNITCFTTALAALCKLGFAILQVNYRGSIGFGTDGIYSLPGLAGTQDVKDIQQVAGMIRSTKNYDKVCVTGGSHGGFLTLHLIAQYPDFYKVAAVRNPVTNIASMVSTTDIPDWSFCESSNEKYSHSAVPTRETYAKMLEASPIARIEKVKAPCLILLGRDDLRVPPTQGKEWAKLYKVLGGNVKVYEYEGNSHPINKVEAEADAFVNMVLWFEKYI